MGFGGVLAISSNTSIEPKQHPIEGIEVVLVTVDIGSPQLVCNLQTGALSTTYGHSPRSVHSRAMTEFSASHRRVLANFLYGIAVEGGWWYRLPRLAPKRTPEQRKQDEEDKKKKATEAAGKKKPAYVPKPDDIMPHFGKAFGLTEDAAALVLKEMGLVSINEKTNATSIDEGGWRDLIDEFGVSNLLEVTPCRFAKMTKSHWYVRLGICATETLKPERIWTKFKKPNSNLSIPIAIGDRRTTAYVTQDLIAILKNSSLFVENLLNTSYFDPTNSSIDVSRIGRNSRNIRAGLLRNYRPDNQPEDNHVAEAPSQQPNNNEQQNTNVVVAPNPSPEESKADDEIQHNNNNNPSALSSTNVPNAAEATEAAPNETSPSNAHETVAATPSQTAVETVEVVPNPNETVPPTLNDASLNIPNTQIGINNQPEYDIPALLRPFWKLTDGVVPSAVDYPICHALNIPTSNTQTVMGLVAELILVLQKSRESALDQKLPKDSFVLTGNASRADNESLYIRVPKGDSASTKWRLAKTVEACISWCAKGDKEDEGLCSQAVVCGIERAYPNDFFDVVTYFGYTSQVAPVMSAEYFTALSTEVRLLTSSQKTLNRYLTQHFGKRVCCSELALANFTSKYVPFRTRYILIPDKQGGKKPRRVLYSWKDITDIISFYIENILGGDPDNIDNIDIALGGDHGKGKFVFIAVFIVHYKRSTGNDVSDNEPIDNHAVQLQIGQIDDSSDSADLLRPLLQELETGIRKTNVGSDGCSTMTVSETDQVTGKREIHYDGRVGKYKIPLKYNLIGDLKFMYMVCGREGFCGFQCLYCKLRAAEWKEQHEAKQSIDCGAEAWTIEALTTKWMDEVQLDASDPNNQPTVLSTPDGQKELPMWSFIPLLSYIIPLLHALLGLGNDLISTNFFKWLDQNVENTTPDEVMARNMTLLASIFVESANDTLTETKAELAVVVADRMQINASLKHTGPLSKEEIKDLERMKRHIKDRELSARELKNDAEADLKAAKQACTEAERKEAELRKLMGKKEKSVRHHIEHEIFPKFNVEFSKYHGGDMEGPSIRRVMQNGTKLFGEIETYLIEVIAERAGDAERLSAASNDPTKTIVELTAEQVRTACQDHGRCALLLDSVFSKFNTKRGCVTPTLIANLRKELLVLMNEWERLGLSETPKLHILINHGPEQLERTGGFAHMAEDAIERFHQERTRDESRLMRLRNETMAKNVQAKIQNTKMMAPVLKVQGEVEKKSKRNLKRKTSLKEEREENKRAKREEARDAALVSAQAQDLTKKVVMPRVMLKQALKDKVEASKKK